MFAAIPACPTLVRALFLWIAPQLQLEAPRAVKSIRGGGVEMLSIPFPPLYLHTHSPFSVLPNTAPASKSHSPCYEAFDLPHISSSHETDFLENSICCSSSPSSPTDFTMHTNQVYYVCSGSGPYRFPANSSTTPRAASIELSRVIAE